MKGLKAAIDRDVARITGRIMKALDDVVPDNTPDKAYIKAQERISKIIREEYLLIDGKAVIVINGNGTRRVEIAS